MNKLFKLFLFLSLCINSLGAIIIKNTTPITLAVWDASETDTRKVRAGGQLKKDYVLGMGHVMGVFDPNGPISPGRSGPEEFQFSLVGIERKGFLSTFAENDVIEIKAIDRPIGRAFDVDIVYKRTFSLKEMAAQKVAIQLTTDLSKKYMVITKGSLFSSEKYKALFYLNSFTNPKKLIRNVEGSVQFYCQYSYYYGLIEGALTESLRLVLLNQPIETALLTLKWIMAKKDFLSAPLKRFLFNKMREEQRFRSHQNDFERMWKSGLEDLF